MKKNMMRGTNALMALTAITMIASVVTAQEVDNPSTVEAYKYIGAGIALGLCGIGTGYSQSQIGAAAVSYTHLTLPTKRNV